MNREMELSLRSWVSDIAILRMIRGELAIGAYPCRARACGRADLQRCKVMMRKLLRKT